MSAHRRRPWRHYDSRPLVYVDVRFEWPSIASSVPGTWHDWRSPRVLASSWDANGTSRIDGVARHRRRQSEPIPSYLLTS